MHKIFSGLTGLATNLANPEANPVNPVLGLSLLVLRGCDLKIHKSKPAIGANPFFTDSRQSPTDSA
jgi:hypothetical protein